MIMDDMSEPLTGTGYRAGYMLMECHMGSNHKSLTLHMNQASSYIVQVISHKEMLPDMPRCCRLLVSSGPERKQLHAQFLMTIRDVEN